MLLACAEKTLSKLGLVLRTAEEDKERDEEQQRSAFEAGAKAALSAAASAATAVARRVTPFTVSLSILCVRVYCLRMGFL